MNNSVSYHEELREIAIADIIKGRYQPRRDFDEQALQELAESIAKSSLIQPIVVAERDGYFELIAGERRWRACQLLNRETITAIVRRGLSEDQLAYLSLIENLQREDLNIFEEAEALSRLEKEFNLTHQEISEAIGKSRVYVTNTIRLRNLEPEIVAMIQSKDDWLNKSHGKSLLALDGSSRISFARMANRNRWTVEFLDKKIREFNELSKGSAKDAKPAKPSYLVKLENALSDYLGAPTEVSFDESDRKGKITIQFTSLEICEGILQKIGFSIDESE